MNAPINTSQSTEVAYAGKVYYATYHLVEKNDPEVPEEPFLVELERVRLNGKDLLDEMDPFDREMIECLLWDHHGY